MKVLIVEPLKAPRPIDIDGSLESMHALVHDDMIEAVYPFPENIALVCSETGKLDGSAPNRIVGNDLIFGPFFICGLGEEDFSSLPDDLIEKYTSLFSSPELFLPSPDGLVVIKVIAGPTKEERE